MHMYDHNQINLVQIKQIEKLREESSINTEAQKEATKNKIQDLKKQLIGTIDI